MFYFYIVMEYKGHFFTRKERADDIGEALQKTGLMSLSDVFVHGITQEPA